MQLVDVATVANLDARQLEPDALDDDMHRATRRIEGTRRGLRKIQL